MIGKWLCSSRNLSYAFASFYGIRGAPSRVPNVTVIPDGVHPSVALERPSSKKATFYCVEFFPLSHGLLRPFFVLRSPPERAHTDTLHTVHGQSRKTCRDSNHEIESFVSEPHKKSSMVLYCSGPCNVARGERGYDPAYSGHGGKR